MIDYNNYFITINKMIKKTNDNKNTNEKNNYLITITKIVKTNAQMNKQSQTNEKTITLKCKKSQMNKERNKKC